MKSEILSTNLKNKMTVVPENKSLYDVMDRSNYLIVQANDLAKAFGNLTLSQHKILDYFTSFIQKDSKQDDIFKCYEHEVLNYFGWTRQSGSYYKYLKNSIERLQSNVIYIKDKHNIIMTNLFSFIAFHKNGKITFQFSSKITPYLVDLKNNYYYFRLSQLSNIKSKYTLIFLKLWEARKNNNSPVTRIYGSLDEWEDWFLGKNKRWTAGRFKQKVLNVCLNEINNKFVLTDINFMPQYRGKKIDGYDITLKGDPKQRKSKL